MKIVKTMALGVLIAGPTAAVGGGYGSAGVADAKVGRYAAQAGIWCPALEATVPQNLYAEMDCGEQNVARSAVAGERITNRPRRGFLGIFAPHEPRGGREPQRDTDSTPIVVANPSNPPSGPTTPDSTPSDPTTPSTPAARVSKWERMNELGVTRENFSQQDPNFLDKVGDFRQSEDFNRDWSTFDPSS